MSDWSHFVIAWLPPDRPQPFPITAIMVTVSRKHRIYASKPMTLLDASFLRWQLSANYQCGGHFEVVYSPMKDSFDFGSGRDRLR